MPDEKVRVKFRSYLWRDDEGMTGSVRFEASSQENRTGDFNTDVYIRFSGTDTPKWDRSSVIVREERSRIRIRKLMSIPYEDRSDLLDALLAEFDRRWKQGVEEDVLRKPKIKDCYKPVDRTHVSSIKKTDEYIHPDLVNRLNTDEVDHMLMAKYVPEGKRAHMNTMYVERTW